MFLQLIADVYVFVPSRYDRRPARLNHEETLDLSHEPKRAH
jgi:hypothetical protein